MNWLKRKLRNWINSDDDCIELPLRAGREHQFDDDPIKFSVTMARGGIVVTSSTYDRVKDRNYNVVHVIHDNEDVAAQVGQIVAMELMKQ
jgi:hypothetical protein